MIFCLFDVWLFIMKATRLPHHRRNLTSPLLLACEPSGAPDGFLWCWALLGKFVPTHFGSYQSDLCFHNLKLLDFLLLCWVILHIIHNQGPYLYTIAPRTSNILGYQGIIDRYLYIFWVLSGNFLFFFGMRPPSISISLI